MDGLGEAGLIDEINRLFASDRDDLLIGIGDDAAVIASESGKMAWTADVMVEGVHFLAAWQTASQLGEKAMRTNLSDLAAMAASPRYALLTLGVPGGLDSAYAIDICRGIQQCAREYGIVVIGGDTTASPGGIIISLALGGIIDGNPLTRSGARSGDAVAVTGTLGDAAAGIRIIEAGAENEYPWLARRFRLPTPRLKAAFAAREAHATAMIDVSDGIATDLRHICEASAVGARLDLTSLPYSNALSDACSTRGWDPLELALSGGEDYELLFTLAREDVDEAAAGIRETGCDIAVIGEITDSPGVITTVDAEGREQELAANGYQHFR